MENTALNPFTGNLDSPSDGQYAGFQSFDGELDGEKKEPGFGERIGQGISRAVDSAKTALTDDPNEIAKIAAEQARTALPQTGLQQQMADEMKPYVDAANKSEGFVDGVTTWGAAGLKRAGQLISHPVEAGKMIAEQLPNSLPGLAGGFAGAKAGAALGTVVAGPGPGTVIGGLIGGVAGGFAGSYGLEKGAAMQEQVQQEAQKRNIDISNEAGVAQMVGENYGEMEATAQRKGVGTAGTDAILNVATMGLAGGFGGRVLAKEAQSLSAAVSSGTITAAEASAKLAALEASNAARNTLGAKAIRGTGVVGSEMAGEGLSEAAGQKYAYGKVDAGEVIDEALMGLGTGGAMAAGHKAFNKAAGIVDQDATTQKLEAMRTTLDGKTEEPQSEPPDAPPPQLGFDPDPLVVFPDGTVGRKDEAEQYVASLPEHQQNAARAKLYGYAPQPADPPQPDPVRESVRQAADAGGALSAAAGLAMDSGASPTYMPPAATEQVATEPPATPVVLQNRDRTTDASIAQMQEIAANPDYLRAGISRDMTNGAPVVFGELPNTAMLGRPETVVDGRGGRVNTQYAIVDAGDVIASNNADGTTVAEYANGLPGKLRAVAGNGRTAGLQRAYEMGTAANYSQELMQDAANLGIDPQAVAGMQRPVLVRVMNQADVTPDMGDRTNTTNTQKLSPVEQAGNDARRFSVANLSFDEQGSPTAQSINGFISAMPVAERGDMLNPNGTPTRQAVDRLMAATFKQAYNSDELVQLHAQATDPDARAVLSAAADASGVMAALSDSGEFDVRPAVTDAVKLAVNAARQGLKLSDVLKNTDFDMNPEAYPVATFLAQNIRSPKAMAEGLRRWGQLALEQARIAEENQRQGGLLGPAPTMTREEIFAHIGDAYNPTEQSVGPRQTEAQPQTQEQQGQIDAEAQAQPVPLPVPGNFSGTPSATMGTRTEAVAGPDFSPANLKEALAYHRARKQQEQAAQATPESAPDLTHLSALENRLSQERVRLEQATTEQERAQEPVQAAAVAQQPTQVDAGKAWAAMPADERAAAAKTAGLNPVQVGTIGKADWGKINPGIQAQLSQAITGQNNQPTLAEEQAQTTAAPATPTAQASTADATVVAPQQAAPTPQQNKAIERVNAGKAVFLSKPKANAFVADSGLADTHEVAQQGKAFRVQAKLAQPATTTAPQQAQTIAQGQSAQSSTDLAGEVPNSSQQAAVNEHARREQKIQVQRNAAPTAAEFGLDMVDANNGQMVDLGQGSLLDETAQHDTINAVAQKLRNLFRAALSRKDGNKDFANIGVVSSEVSARITEATGLDLTGYTHSIDESSMRHMMKQHGNVEKEASRGQVAITEDDIALIPQIVSAPDEVIKGEAAETGSNESVVFKKKMGDAYVYVQEIRGGRKKLAAKTLWKVRIAPPAATEVGKAHTSETLDRNTSTGKDSLTASNSVDKPTNTKEGIAKIQTTEKKAEATKPAEAPKTDATPDIRFSRTDTPAPPARGVSAKARMAMFNRLADSIAARWANAPKIVVATNMDDPAIPDSARQSDALQRSNGARGHVEGFWHEGTAYILTDNLQSAADAVRVLLHESLGHHGLRGVFGPKLDAILSKVIELRRDDVLAKAEQYGLNPNDEADLKEAAEEVLATMAQENPKLPLVRRAIAAIRSWLREHMPMMGSLALTDDEIIRSYILPARAFVERGRANNDAASQPQFNRTDNAAHANDTDPGQADNSEDTRLAIAALERKLGVPYQSESVIQGWTSRGILGVTPIANAFGTTVIGYKVRPEKAVFDVKGLATSNGLRYLGKTFLNVSTNRPHLAVLGHETAHEIRRNRPDIYHHLVNSITTYVDFAKYNNKFAQSVVGRGSIKEGMTDEQQDASIQEEFIGEVLSDGFMDRNFWRALGNKNPGLLAEVWGAVSSLLNKVFSKYGQGYTRQTEQYLTDYNKVMQIAGEVMAEYGMANPTTGNSSNPGIRFSRVSQAISNAVNERKTVVAGSTERYTPAQMEAMKNVGFQVEQPSLKERAQALWQDAGKKLAQGIVDQFAPVKEISKDAYALLRLSKGASGAFETLLQGGKLKLSDGVYNFDEANKGGVVDKLLTPLGGEHHDFFRWVAANRAESLMGEGRENLFTPEAITALKTLADGDLSFDYTVQHGIRKGRTTRKRAEAYRDSLTTFNEFNKNVLDMAEQSGLIDAESRATWESEFYVPFYRVADEESGGVRGMNIKGSVVRQKAFERLKGGKQKLNHDLLDNTLMNWAHLLDAAAKNRAAKATLEAAANVGVAIEAPKGTLDNMASSINKKDGIVWFMDEGKKRFFMVDDPYLMTAISSLEFAGMNSPIMNVMGSFKRALTIGVTASPFFKVRNLIRDSVQVIGVSDIGTNPLKNLADGWKLTDPKNDAYFRLLAGGGTIHFGTMMEGSEAKRVQALVESGVADSAILNNEHKVKQFYRKFIEPGITAYNELGNRGEAVNRAALYDQLTKQGVSHAEASLMARDLMDFSMQGSFTSIRFLTQVVPFFNARLQGMYKLGRAAKEDPKRMAYVTGAIAMASLALLAAYGDDDDWKKREESDRNNFWWFKLGGTAFRIPKPFELGAIATLAERSAEYLFDDEMTGKRLRGQVLKLLGDNLSMNPIPQAFKPLLDVYANKDSFRDAPIESMGMEKLKPEYRFNDRTSMVARAASTAANAVTNTIGVNSPSPVQIDHLLRGYLGWLGTFAVGTADMIARPATNQPTQATPDYWKMATGSMVSDLRDAPSRYVSSIYDQAKELEQAYGTWRALQKSGKPQEAAEFLAENRDEITRHGRVAHVKTAESKLNERIRQIERSDMGSDAKHEAIRAIRVQKEGLAKMLAQRS